MGLANNKMTWTRALFISLAINAIIFGMFFLFFTPCFDTVDDAIMLLTASGVTTGTPSEYVIYSNVIVGLALKFLYLHASNIRWYPIYLYLAHFIAMTVILCSIIRRKPDWPAVFHYLGLFIIFEMPLLMRLQFTSAASALALGGFCLFITTLDSRGGKAAAYLVIASALVAGGGLIRIDSVYLLAFLAAPVLLTLMIGKSRRQAVVFVLLSAVLLTALACFDDAYYMKDPQWAKYHQYQIIRDKLHGYPKLDYNERNRPVFDHVGWSKNDERIFAHGFNFDQTVYSIEKITYVEKNAHNWRNLSDTIKTLKEPLKANLPPIIATLVYLIFLAMGIGKERRGLICAQALTAVLICIWLSHTARLPDRVFLPVLLFLSLTSLVESVSATAEKPSPQNKYLVVIVVALLTCLLGAQVFSAASQSRTNRTDQIYYYKILAGLPRGADDLILMRGSVLPIGRTPPFSDLNEYRGLHLLFIDHLINSPLNAETLSRFHQTSLLSAINSDKHLFMLSRDQFIPIFYRYFAEHHLPKPRFKVIASYDKGKYLLSVNRPAVRRAGPGR